MNHPAAEPATRPWVRALVPRRSPRPHRSLAGPLQHDPYALNARLPTTGTGGDRPRLNRNATATVRLRSASRQPWRGRHPCSNIGPGPLDGGRSACPADAPHHNPATIQPTTPPNRTGAHQPRRLRGAMNQPLPTQNLEYAEIENIFNTLLRTAPPPFDGASLRVAARRTAKQTAPPPNPQVRLWHYCR